MGRLIHKIKNPMNNETWEAVGHQYIVIYCPGDRFTKGRDRFTEGRKS
jgi:hypothetical protein